MRRLVEELERAFENVHNISRNLVEKSEFSELIRINDSLGFSPCELVVRSAAKVEQCCGGITTRLWDDPFEWTLPESFLSKQAVIVYLDEVAATRIRAFKVIHTDADLLREIPAPLDLTSLFSILLSALTSASHFTHLAIAALSDSPRETSAEQP